MIADVRANIEKLERVVKRSRSAYGYAAFSFVVLKPPRAEPVFLTGSIVLTPVFDPNKFVGFSHESALVVAQTLYWPITRDKGHLYPVSEIAQGFILNPTDAARFRFTSNPDAELWSQYDSGESLVQGNQPRAMRLIIRGQTLSQAIESIGGIEVIDSDLQSSAIPFNGLQDICRTLGINAPDLRTNPTPPAAELTIAGQNLLVIERGNCSLSEGKISIQCILAKGIDRSLVRVGGIPFGGAIAQRFSLVETDLEWEEQETVDKCSLAKTDGAQPPALLILLTYDSVLFDRWWIFDPKKHISPTFGLHNLWDKDLSELRAYLSGASKNPADDVEAGVALLLGLLRFSVMHYGLMPKLRDGPDMLALTDRNQLLVIECTSAIPSTDKIGRLVARTEQIRASLQQSNNNFIDTLPVLVSSMNRDSLPTAIAEATRHGVVVAKEQLDDALRRLPMPPSSWELFDELKRGLETQSVTG